MDLFVQPTVKDLIFLVVVTIGTGAVVILGELLQRKTSISAENARKVIHLSTGNFILFVPILFDHRLYAIIPPVIFAVVNFMICPLSPIKHFRIKAYSKGNNLGTVYYPISLSFLLLLAFDHPIVMNVAFLPLVWGDGLGAIIGKKHGSRTIYTIANNPKSWVGSWTVYTASVIAILISFAVVGLLEFETFTWVGMVLITLAVAPIAALIEGLTPWDLDNITIVAVGGVAASFLVENEVNNLKSDIYSKMALTCLITLWVVFSLLVYRKHRSNVKTDTNH
ncbi:MAG: diacylglycerol/polyprenol kinase family protein [Candidatus Kariarchaeaceae archaeon]